MSGKNLLNMRRGALVMTALAALFMLGMTALVTDVGYLYYSQSRLQTAVNAGWKAGYDRMLTIVRGRYVPTDEQKTIIENHIKDVMMKNGYTAEQLASVVISYSPATPRPSPGYYLKVESTQNVGLFFARMMSFAASDVYASRENHANDLGQGVVPLAIPHGDVSDLSRSTYSFAPFGADGGFTAGGEYLLKLGSGGGNVKAPPREEPNPDDPVDPEEPGPEDPYLLFIPMGAGDQSDTGYLKAYGVIYSCLGTPAGAAGNVPVYWLLDYRGGAFIIKFTTTHRDMLDAAGVNYQGLDDEAAAQPHFDAAGIGVFELYYQRKVAVYSNSLTTDATAQALTDAGIPFTTINDAAIQSGALNNYHLVLMAPDDLTGYSGGCGYYDKPCEYFLLSGALGSIGNKNQRATTALYMCTQCQSYYDSEPGTFDARAKDECLFKGTRCAEKVSGAAKEKIWGETKTTGGNVNLVYPNLVCGTSTKTLCYDFIMKSEALSEEAPFPTKPYAVQVLKWNSVSKIREHVATGGYILGHGFSAETLDLALWQKGINDGAAAYEYCMAFEGMAMQNFPARRDPVHYSNITSVDDLGNLSFNLYRPAAAGDTPDPRCQNHVDSLSTGLAETNAFNPTVMADAGVSIGDKANGDVKYLKGYYLDGEYCHLGGSIGASVEAKRLVLNNVLYADTSEKVVAGYITPPIVSRQKGKYGPLDPDNYVGGGANDYRDWFMTGFTQPLQVNDRVITENGNMRGPTDQAVEFRLDGDTETPPSRRIIVPITDIPPEVAALQPGVDSVYSLQGNDNPEGVYDPTVASFTSAIRIIGFAEFELIAVDDFTNDENLGPYQPGQVRGRFIRYIVKPGEIPLY